MASSSWKRAGVIALLFATAVVAQPRFEVAVIKPVDPTAEPEEGITIFPGGRVVIRGASLKDLIGTAFGLGYWQLAGGEPWMDKDQFDIQARPSADLRPTITDLRHSIYYIEDERLCLMLQAMIINRFKLQFHRETKTGKVYFLEKKGSTQALRPAEWGSAGGSLIGFGAKWIIRNSSMAQLASFATDLLHIPIADRTGLPGYFDYTMTTNLAEPEASDLFGAFHVFLQETGLKLESGKGPVETFVIDHAEKPTPN